MKPGFTLLSIILLPLITFFISCEECSCDHSKLSALNPIKEIIIDSLAHPWSMVFIDEEDVLLSEKEGNLLRINLESKDKTVIKGFPGDLFQPITIDAYAYPQYTYPTSIHGRTVWGNGGILDVVLDPEYRQNSKVYISYVSQRGDEFALKVISADLTGDSLQSIQTLLNPGPYVPGLWHFGGGLCIHKNHLYITAGERLFFEIAHEGLPIAQDITDARGAIYRINLDGSIPEDNPDLGTQAVPGIFAIGIRAAQGICVRPATDEIWFSEHGTVQGDEINLLRPGANYGWPNITTGKWRTPDYVPDSLPNPVYTEPQHFWLQTVAPTGLTFYTGTEFPSWNGNLIVPGLSRGSLWRLVLEGQTIISVEELFTNDHVRSRKVVQSPGGKLYMLTDEDNGKIVLIKNKFDH